MLIDTITQWQPVDKGWSGDKKYHVWDRAGRDYLLRISPPERRERVALCFRRMRLAAGLEIPMSRPLEFGDCPQGVYILTDWIRGRDAEAVLPSLPQKGQYAYGLDAGRILKKIHSIPAPADVIPWSEYFNRKIDRKLVSYAASSLKYDGGEAFLTFITQNRHLLSDRPQTYQHGDYHIGNMMVDDHGVLTIIDFEKDDYGDPWEEFNRIVWCAQATPAFAAGMVDGYFDGTVPMEFWRLLTLYICSNTLGSLPWAIPFGEEEIQVMRRQAAQVLQWYNGMTNVVPTWYHT